MDWSLVHNVSTTGWSLAHNMSAVATFISLGIFMLSSYKAGRSIRTARKLTRHLYLVRGNLRYSINQLRKEHTDLRYEIRNMSKTISQSIQVRNEIDRSLTRMTQIHSQLQQETLRASANSMRTHQKNHKLHNKAHNKSHNTGSRNLPVFVHRTVEKSSHTVI